MWWRDRDVTSATSQAFARASAEGLVHSHSQHRSTAGYAFIVTTPDPDRARSILEPAYGAALALVQSTKRDHDGVMERLEHVLGAELESKVFALGWLRGSDYQRYPHIVVDRITPNLVEAIAQHEHDELVVESIVEPLR